MTVSTRQDNVREAGQGFISCWRITRESSGLVYSWGIDGKEKTEEFGIVDTEEYHKRRLKVCYTHTHTYTYTHTHTHTHIPKCKCFLRCAKGQQMCASGGRLSYGWRCVEILNGGLAIGRTKKEGRNSYRGVWYWFYGKSTNQMGPRAGRAVL